MTGDGFCGHCAKLVAGDVLGHPSYGLANNLHGKAAIGTEEAIAAAGLAGGTVDDSNEVIGDDDSVLAFLRGVLRDEALFDDLHTLVMDILAFLLEHATFGRAGCQVAGPYFLRRVSG